MRGARVTLSRLVLRHRTPVLLVLGVFLCGLAAWSSWSYLASPADASALQEEALTFTYENGLEAVGSSPILVSVNHDYEEEQEGIYITFTPAPRTGTLVRVDRTVGGLDGPDWFCGSGAEYYHKAVRPGMQPLTSAGLRIEVGKTVDPPGADSFARTAAYDAFGIACNRFGAMTERQPQGLVYVMPARANFELQDTGEIRLYRSEQMDLPDTWNLVDNTSAFQTQENGSVTKGESASSTSLSRVDEAVENDRSFEVAGLHIVEDVSEAHRVERRAWVSALLAGAGIGLLTAAAGAQQTGASSRESGAKSGWPDETRGPWRTARPRRSGRNATYLAFGSVALVLIMQLCGFTRRR